MKNKLLLLASILIPALASWAHDDYHGGLLFTANLEGGQEVPAVTSGAKGLIGFKLNPTRDTIFIAGSVVGLKSAITKLHIHSGRKGVAGPMLTDLSAKVKGNSISIAWTGFTRADVLNLLKGAYYINVHTAAFPDGEVRGQLELEKDHIFTIELRGESEVPAIASEAKGAAILRLSPDNSVLTVDAVFQGLRGTLTAVHLHKGAPGTNGDKAIDLTDSLVGKVGGANATSTKVRLSTVANAAAFLDSLRKGSVYMNVHTSAFANGELRGYVNPDTDRVFIANLSGANEVPPLAGQGVGLGFFRLSSNDSLLTVFGVFQGLGHPVTKLHMHAGAAGMAGSVVADLSAFASGNSISTAIGIFSLPDPGAFLDSLVKGSLYFNVHTGPNASGEIRGQITDVKPWESLVGIAASAPRNGFNQPKILITQSGLKIKTAEGSLKFLDLKVFDLKGGLEAERILPIGKDGLSQSFSVSNLTHGIHIGIWQEGSSAYRIPFLVR